MKLFSLRNLEKLFGRKLESKPKPAAKKRGVRKRRFPKLKIETQGDLYDLKAIYNSINASYFEGKLELEITWFGSAKRRARRHRKLGLYCFHDKLIKIHRLLDQTHFPPYFISYVVYHEMLHSVCPPVKVKKGRYSIHHSDFKQKEMEFAEYAVAKRWEEENKRLFFQLS
ncbi:MAG: hypothetical protein JSS60_09465 [Verrucomicrobia bacterium]|nr:hypothetical protein [Verrucomicrobiota bacterium]